LLPVGQHLSTIGNVGDFFALLVSHPFKGSGAKPARGHKKGKAEMARRQTETTYLQAVWLWLREYWTD
jgi:hypothetical protein